MPEVNYSPEAEKDLLGIATFIARDKPEAARQWMETIRRTCETLASQPELGELRRDFGVPDCRCFSVGNYLIFFRQVNQSIEVSRIIHGSRDMWH